MLETIHMVYYLQGSDMRINSDRQICSRLLLATAATWISNGYIYVMIAQKIHEGKKRKKKNKNDKFVCQKKFSQ